MRNRALFAVCLLALAIASAAKARSASYAHLNPGSLSDLPETVPVNIVFVGYEPSLIDQSRFLSDLPATYRPIVRSRYPYGITEELGLRYTFDYHVTFTSTRWEDNFFSALSALATEAPKTLFQQQYKTRPT